MRASISCMSRLDPDRSAIWYRAWRRRSDLRRPSIRDCARALAQVASMVLRASASQPSRRPSGSPSPASTTSAIRVASRVHASLSSVPLAPDAAAPPSSASTARTCRLPARSLVDVPLPSSGSCQPTATDAPAGSVRASSVAMPASPWCTREPLALASTARIFTSETPPIPKHNGIRALPRQTPFPPPVRWHLHVDRDRRPAGGRPATPARPRRLHSVRGRAYPAAGERGRARHRPRTRRRSADAGLCAGRRGGVRAALRAPPAAPVPLPAGAAARRRAGRRTVPGRVAEGDRRARGLEAGGRVRDLAVPDRAQPPGRPLARPAPPAGGAGRRRRAHRPGARSRHAGAAAVGVRAAPPAAARARRAAARAARGGDAAPGAGTEPGGDRGSDRRGAGNGEIAPALRDGQAARPAGPGGGAVNRPPHEPLDPAERELARRLAQLDAKAAPSPALDAAILAAARAEAAGSGAPPQPRPAPHARRRRLRWPVGFGIAASLALALGVAWQLRPVPDAVVERPSEAAAVAGPPAPAARPLAAPAMPAAGADPDG